MDPANSPLVKRVADTVCRDLLRPQDELQVLDVGCGEGALLADLAGRGVRGVGLEQAPAAAVLDTGVPVVSASAEALPFADRSIPVVVLRHVPHHLRRPRLCLAEAARVARRRLVLAEPFFQPGLPGQEAGREADSRLKALDRRRGSFHAESLDAAELLALLDPRDGRIQAQTFVPIRAWTEPDLRQRLALAQGSLRLEAEEAAAWERLLRLAQEGNISRNGTLVLSLDWA